MMVRREMPALPASTDGPERRVLAVATARAVCRVMKALKAVKVCLDSTGLTGLMARQDRKVARVDLGETELKASMALLAQMGLSETRASKVISGLWDLAEPTAETVPVVRRESMVT